MIPLSTHKIHVRMFGPKVILYCHYIESPLAVLSTEIIVFQNDLISDFSSVHVIKYSVVHQNLLIILLLR